MPHFISQGRQRYPFALEYKKLLAFLKIYSFLNLFWPTYHMVKASFLTLGQTFELVFQYQVSTINTVFQFRPTLKVLQCMTLTSKHLVYMISTYISKYIMKILLSLKYKAVSSSIVMLVHFSNRISTFSHQKLSL